MRKYLVAVIFAAASACSSSQLSTEPIVLSQSEAADSVKIRVGQVVIVEGVKIRFMSVEADSRCPQDVVCVWAGDATANFSIELNCECRAAAIQLPLHLNAEPRSGTAYGYRVELRGIEPATHSESEIKPEAYRAWVRIVKVE